MGHLRVVADIDEKLVLGLKRYLAKNNITFKQWLMDQMTQYLEKEGGGEKSKKKAKISGTL